VPEPSTPAPTGPEPIRVAAVGDIADEEAIVVDGAANGTGAPIAVFHAQGRYWALDDTCSHERASLAEGWVEDDVVSCPLHGAEFSLETGEALSLPATRPVRTHRVEVRDSQIWLYPGVPADPVE